MVITPARSAPATAVRSALATAVLAALVLAALVLAPGAGVPAPRAAAAVLVAGPAPAGAPSAAPALPDHDCIVPGRSTPRVDWGRLRNPILSVKDAGVKDPALIWASGRWHLLVSYVTDGPSPGSVHWDIATSTSTDMARWTTPVPWPDQPGTLGVASPDVVRAPGGRFVVTYQSDPGQTDGAQSRLYYRTTTDFDTWSAPRALAPGLAPSPSARMIDPALAWSDHRWYLAYKSGSTGATQRFRMAISPGGSLGGPWRPLGTPDLEVVGGTIENYELVGIGSTVHLFATSNNLDEPWTFTMEGNPDRTSSWLHWGAARQLSVPTASWDSGSGVPSIDFEPTNSVFFCDARAALGSYYLVYAGSDELTRFGGWGHAEIGIARSTDLVHWQTPPH